MQVFNQRPSALVPFWDDDISADLDQAALEKALGAILAPVRTPLLASNPKVDIIDNDGNAVSDQDIVDMVLRCCGNTVNTDAEDFCRDLFRNTLALYDKSLPAEAVFIAQANAMPQRMAEIFSQTAFGNYVTRQLICLFGSHARLYLGQRLFLRLSPGRADRQ